MRNGGAAVYAGAALNVLNKGLPKALLRFQVALVHAQRFRLVIVEARHAALQALKKWNDSLQITARPFADQFGLQLGQLGKGPRVFLFHAQILFVQPQRFRLLRLVFVDQVLEGAG